MENQSYEGSASLRNKAQEIERLHTKVLAARKRANPGMGEDLSEYLPKATDGSEDLRRKQKRF